MRMLTACCDNIYLDRNELIVLNIRLKFLSIMKIIEPGYFFIVCQLSYAIAQGSKREQSTYE